MYTYVIGDIQGMLDKLESLLRKIPFKKDRDTLAFVGNYVGRGPDSKGVIDRVLSLRDRGLRLICLKGNHEQMFLNFLAGREPHIFLLNRGNTTLDSYRKQSKGSIIIPAVHLSFLQELLPYYEAEDFILVHAGLRPGVALERQEEEDLLWIEQEFIHSRFDFGKRVVFGHTWFKTPYVDGCKIGIDTGAAHGNRLSCVRLPDVIFYSV